MKASIVHFADGGSAILDAESGEPIDGMALILVTETKHYMAVPIEQFEAFKKFISNEESTA